MTLIPRNYNRRLRRFVVVAISVITRGYPGHNIHVKYTYTMTCLRLTASLYLSLSFSSLVMSVSSCLSDFFSPLSLYFANYNSYDSPPPSTQNLSSASLSTHFTFHSVLSRDHVVSHRKKKIYIYI